MIKFGSQYRELYRSCFLPLIVPLSVMYELKYNRASLNLSRYEYLYILEVSYCKPVSLVGLVSLEEVNYSIGIL